jgi:Asp-tRNA(Asn)/Glu-tRNA(Gln) amidotransferase A subunit family amidase
MVRKRKTEKAMLEDIDGPLLRRTLELIGEIEEGRRTCEVANLELLAAYQRLQERAPALNAVIVELPPGDRSPEGPLHGIAVAVKDNIDVQGVVTTNASTVGTPPPALRDAPVVTRLRDAAADLLCKTNLLEYAAGSVNPAFGMTYNPRDSTRTAGGSSTGSAALVAAGVCDYALGTDTGGSIRIPASYCGVVGLKPSYGLVPVDGVFPLSASCDHVGTLTATVRQTATLLQVLSGRPVELRPATGLRVGVLCRQVDDSDVTEGVRSRVLEALAALEAAGFELIDIDVPELDIADAALGAVVLKEAWDIHKGLYEREADKYGPGTRALLELGATISDDDYRQGLIDQARVAAGFARAFETVSVLAGPTVAYPAPPEDPPFGTPEGDVEGRFTAPYNLAGVPAVSVPCGIAEGTLPAGLQLAAALGEDALLLSIAQTYEEVVSGPFGK